MTELVVRRYLVTFASRGGVNVEDFKMLGALALIRAGEPDRALVAEDFEFYGRAYRRTAFGTVGRGVSLVESLMGDSMYSFPASAKSRIDTLVDNLQEAYRISIQRAG